MTSQEPNTGAALATGGGHDAKKMSDAGAEASTRFPNAVDRLAEVSKHTSAAPVNMRFVAAAGSHHSYGKKHNNKETGMSLYWWGSQPASG
jgi:hypothetical protein